MTLFLPISCFISEMLQQRAIVTMESEQETARMHELYKPTSRGLSAIAKLLVMSCCRHFTNRSRYDDVTNGVVGYHQVAPRRDPACIRDPASIKINVNNCSLYTS